MPYVLTHTRGRLRAGGLLLAALTLVAPTTGAAPRQEHQHDPAHASPYADQEGSGIAALSLQELQDLESGAGMGLARAAELHHYPGPKHVLELAVALQLSTEQRQAVEDIQTRMLAEAVRLGAEIIALERALDRRFAHAHVDADAVRAATAEIAGLRGELRAVHLVAHLETRALLEEQQVRAYDRARGYIEGPAG